MGIVTPRTIFLAFIVTFRKSKCHSIFCVEKIVFNDLKK